MRQDLAQLAFSHPEPWALGRKRLPANDPAVHKDLLANDGGN